jgi:hypothetical protein
MRKLLLARAFHCVLLHHASLAAHWYTALWMKVKLSLCVINHHAMKTYGGSERVASRIVNLGARWSWVIGFTLRSLYSRGKSPWRLGGPYGRFEHIRDENDHCICRESSPWPSHDNWVILRPSGRNYVEWIWYCQTDLILVSNAFQTYV